MSKPPANSPVESPCVKTCCLNEADICLGCGRTLTEITSWSASNRETRLQIRELARKRLGLPPENIPSE